MTDEPSVTSLLRRAQRNPAAFDAVYEALVRDLYRYLAHSTGESELARDLTAETFALALENLNGFRGLRSQSGRAWIFRIAERLVAQHARSQRVELRACERLGILTAFALADDAVDRDLIVSRCDDEAVRMRVIDDRSYAEIGVALGCSESAARQRVSRKLRELRHELEAE